MDELLKVELELEKDAMDAGASRYFTRAAKAPERTRPGTDLIRKMIPPLVVAIEEWVEKAKSGKACRDAGLALFASQLPAEHVAFVTARAAVHAIAEQTPLTMWSRAVAQTLEDALLSEALLKADPKGWKRLMTKAEKASFPGKRFILVKNALGKSQVKRISWDKSTKIRLGATLLTMCGDVTGLYTIQNVRMGLRTIARLHATEEIALWLSKSHQRCSLTEPLYMPMVVPPNDWSGFAHGGYKSRELRVRIVSSARLNRAYVEEMKHHDMPEVYKALNAVQATPWRINSRVLKVIREVWDGGGNLGKLPRRELLPLPAAPWGDGPAPDKSTPEWKEHMAKLARTHEINEAVASKRFAMSAKIQIGEKFEGFEAIYFPHVLDWRGRLYALPPYVNPQADDSGRALLEFANGCALGEEGAYWLAVHGANCYGIDKVSFDERVKWVEENQDAIRDSATNPLDGHRFWASAEDPYLFLAFCFEWADLMEHVGRGEAQESFVSTLPVSWDGSCNGLQNFSAMLRDPVGGAATNLLPQPKPADIYQRVADVASARVNRDAAEGEVNARYWVGKVTRKIAKRPTMTLPYGSGRYGFRDQLRSELQHLKMEHGEPYIKGDEFLCSMYLANVLYEALGQVVVAARTAMDWLKEVSQIAAQENLPVWWTAPSGFRVMQEYRQMIGKEIDFHANGRRLCLTIQVEGAKLDKRKQAQGISPNFIHSLDAAHLVRTVSKCVDAGVSSFAMVHDSYGTHAGNAGALHQMLRAAFVEQYSANALEGFRTELAGQLSPERAAKLPPVPPMGDLELSQVMGSDYFFA